LAVGVAFGDEAGSQLGLDLLQVRGQGGQLREQGGCGWRGDALEGVVGSGPRPE
jgi:hypothetical protein